MSISRQRGGAPDGASGGGRPELDDHRHHPGHQHAGHQHAGHQHPGHHHPDHDHAGHDHAGHRLPAGPAGLGFPAGALRRVVAAAGFAVGAILLAWTVERPDGGVPLAAAPSAALASAPTATLTCETTSPAQWRVSVGGMLIAPTDSAPQRWIGTLSLPAGRNTEIVIEAAADPGAPGGPRALRLRLASAGPPIERVVWGEGDLVETVRFQP